jgi:hypothetical protein
MHNAFRSREKVLLARTIEEEKETITPNKKFSHENQFSSESYQSGFHRQSSSGTRERSVQSGYLRILEALEMSFEASVYD